MGIASPRSSRRETDSYAGPDDVPPPPNDVEEDEILVGDLFRKER